LADYAIQRHYPHLEHLSDKYLSFLRAVMQCQASLVAQWQLVGFIHGVMNTDNMAISGETIDYGPCAFMNTYDPNTVFSSIDRNGRYAYGNQPLIAQWNLARLAESLLPLLDPVREQAIALATDTIGEFPSMFEHCWLAGMRKKLGLQSMADADLELIQTLLSWMHTVGADFTNTFRDLSTAARPSLELYQSSDFADWYDRWLSRLQNENTTLGAAAERMQAVNPVVIPRNHKVEEALDAAESQNDLSVMYDLLEVLKSPFNRSEAAAPYQVPPVDDKCYQTYCGT
jgi:uncharacterized protein YdiU (UPF0061 family)